MGSKVAQAVAARRPAGLAGVLLVAPAPTAPVGSLEQLQQLTMHAFDDEQSVQQSIDHMLTHQSLRAELRKQIVDDSLRAGSDARLVWPRYVLAQDVSEGLSNVTIPVLVLAGDHDRVEPPAVLAEHLLPLIPHTTMTVLEDTGHLSPLELPGQVARQITALSRTAPGSPQVRILPGTHCQPDQVIRKTGAAPTPDRGGRLHSAEPSGAD
jgi:pimeloyl-ACP methyl ester carboxylesterase